jgi:hypothetical protein
MEQEEVLRVLGTPDDIRTAQELQGRINSITSEVWYWGTSGQNSAATLGSVHFSLDRKVSLVIGGTEKALDVFPVPEPRLRALLNILDRVPSYNAWEYFDPRRVIHAVNSLQPLGKEGALAVIREYLRVTYRLHRDDGPNGVFLVLRTLFEVPKDPGYLPRMKVGYTKQEPKDPTIFPRFPLALIEDIPILLAEGYSLVGAEEPVEKHLSYFEEHGILRKTLLKPTDRPFEILKLLESAISGLADNESARPRIHSALAQVLRILDTVFQPPTDSSVKGIGKLEEEVIALHLRWDFKDNRYTFQDGTVLPTKP